MVATTGIGKSLGEDALDKKKTLAFGKVILL